MQCVQEAFILAWDVEIPGLEEEKPWETKH